MIFNQKEIFSDAQAITATAVSTNVIDLGVAGTPYGAAAALNNDKGKGVKIPVLAQVVEDFDNLTSLAIAIENSANSDMSSATVLTTQTILLADLVAGKQISVDVLPNDITKRYLALRYTVTGTAPTTGKVTAGITTGNQNNVTGA